jgi:hypothetical protein
LSLVCESPNSRSVSDLRRRAENLTDILAKNVQFLIPLIVPPRWLI